MYYICFFIIYFICDISQTYLSDLKHFILFYIFPTIYIQTVTYSGCDRSSFVVNIDIVGKESKFKFLAKMYFVRSILVFKKCKIINFECRILSAKFIIVIDFVNFINYPV